MTKSLIIFDERYKVTSVPFCIPDFNLLSCEFDNVTFKVLFWVILYSNKKEKKEKKEIPS